MTDEQLQALRDHEAAHAAAAIALGVNVHDLRIKSTGGCVTFYVDADMSTTTQARMLLAPLVLENRAPTWPLVGSIGTDEGDLADLAERARIGPIEYALLVEVTEDLVESQTFKALFHCIATILATGRNHLDANRLEAIAATCREPMT